MLMPELEFEMGGHALGGRFTTLEGLLRNVADNLENNPFLGTGTLEGGDTATEDQRARMARFNAELEACIGGGRQFVFVMDDPTGNSYLQVNNKTYLLQPVKPVRKTLEDLDCIDLFGGCSQ